MHSLWNWLGGKKTYLLGLIGIAVVVLKASGDALEGSAVDWGSVVQQVVAALTAMALRHGIARQ